MVRLGDFLHRRTKSTFKNIINEMIVVSVGLMVPMTCFPYMLGTLPPGDVGSLLAATAWFSVAIWLRCRLSRAI